MLKMFTTAVKVETLYLCCKQIFPLLATCSKWPSTKMSTHPQQRTTGSAQRGEKKVNESNTGEKIQAAE